MCRGTELDSIINERIRGTTKVSEIEVIPEEEAGMVRMMIENK